MEIFSSGGLKELAIGIRCPRQREKQVQRQVQKHGMLEARSGKIRIPLDLGHWAPSLKEELS